MAHPVRRLVRPPSAEGEEMTKLDIEGLRKVANAHADAALSGDRYTSLVSVGTFLATFSPQVILELLSEVENLRRENDHMMNGLYEIFSLEKSPEHAGKADHIIARDILASLDKDTTK